MSSSSHCNLIVSRVQEAEGAWSALPVHASQHLVAALGVTPESATAPAAIAWTASATCRQTAAPVSATKPSPLPCVCGSKAVSTRKGFSAYDSLAHRRKMVSRKAALLQTIQCQMQAGVSAYSASLSQTTSSNAAPSGPSPPLDQH